ncbi:hypothetical protein BJY16_005198 [Actinoplanes octamycinicus]|uniref:Fibronectin type-III domain-containing protein n=1 Tax=Actinoplanes octamycinicus TaxID=135948 RepID=A0A7W7M990_9ACTN|nr:fibronectin type III domain-containing protein [Actinoplanes octamycinicus]MBB4741739.1 hypothetical protein [Actinoplanes octamycinicus]GIE57292.1 hypothetical protein Aoc01nite_26940 [Actinoplanes octamycinicus]
MSVERLRRRAAGILVLLVSGLCVLVGVTRAAASAQVEAITGLLTYTADADGAIWRIRPDGDLTLLSDPDDNGPARDIAVGKDGFVYAVVADPAKVVRFAPDGATVDWGSGQLTDPTGIDVDQTTGHVYVSDSTGVHEFDDEGNETPVSIPGLVSAKGVAIDPAGVMFVADFNADTGHTTVRRVENGEPSVVGSPFTFGVTTAIDVDSHENVYLAAPLRGEYEKVSPGGTRSVVAQPNGSVGGVAVDAHDNVWAADPDLGTVSRISGDDALDPSTITQLTSPTAVDTWTVPLPPASVTAMARDEAVEVRWTASDANGSHAVTRYTARVVGTERTCTTTGTSCTISGLSNDVAYTVTVAATNTGANDVGQSAPSAASDPVTPHEPTYPSSPTLTAQSGNAEAALTITPGDDGGSPVIRWEVSQDRDAWTTLTTTPSGEDLTATVTGLANSYAVTLWVRAVNAVGPSVSQPIEVTPMPELPGAPASLTAAPGNQSARLLFNPPEDDGGSPIDHYEVKIDEGDWETVYSAPADGGALRADVLGLDNGTTYTVHLRAVNALGPGAGITDEVTPATAPDAPADVTTSPQDEGAILEFAPPAEDGGAAVDYYEVATADDAWERATLSPAEEQGRWQATVTGLTNGQTYWLKLRAVNSQGPGAETGAWAYPAAVPGKPTGVILTPRVRGARIVFTTPDDGGSGITGYEYSVDNGGTWHELHASPNVEDESRATLESYLNDLTGRVQYSVRVRATNSRGTGPASDAATVTPIGTPLAPTDLTATARRLDDAYGYGSATVVFEPPTDTGGSEITGYQLTPDDGETWFDLDVTPTGEGATTLRGSIDWLMEGETYAVRVRAVNDAGEGDPSESYSLAAKWPPGTPGAFYAVPGNQEALLVFGQPDSGGDPITSYEVSIDGGDWTALDWRSSDDREDLVATLTGLANDVELSVQLRARNSLGVGEPVSTTFTPSAAAVMPEEPAEDPIEEPVEEPSESPTPEPSPEPSAETPSPEPSPSITTASPSPSVSTPSPTPAPSPSPTPSPTTPSPSPTPTTPSPSPTPTTASPSPTPTTPSSTPTTPGPSPSATTAAPTPSVTSASPTPSATSASPTPSTTSASPTPSATTPSPSPSAASPSATPSPTPSATPSATPSPSESAAPPGSPSGVTAQAGISSIVVSWNPPADASGVARYRAMTEPGPGTCTSSGTSCVIGAAAGTSYTVTVVALGKGGESAASAASNTVTPTTPAIPDTVPNTDKPLTTPAGTSNTVAPGGTVTIKGKGYAPFSTVTVTLYSDPLELGTATADAAGEISLTVTIPAGVPVGTHSIVASGVDSNGNALVRRLDVKAAAKDTTTTTKPLPTTGPAVLWLLIAGSAITATGAAARILAARRS